MPRRTRESGRSAVDSLFGRRSKDGTLFAGCTILPESYGWSDNLVTISRSWTERHRDAVRETGCIAAVFGYSSRTAAA